MPLETFLRDVGLLEGEAAAELQTLKSNNAKNDKARQLRPQTWYRDALPSHLLTYCSAFVFRTDLKHRPAALCKRKRTCQQPCLVRALVLLRHEQTCTPRAAAGTWRRTLHAQRRE